MNLDPQSTGSHPDDRNAPIAVHPPQARSAFWRGAIDFGFTWYTLEIIAIAVFGIGALVYAVVKLDPLALALALIALPLAFIGWCMAKAARDAGKDS